MPLECRPTSIKIGASSTRVYSNTPPNADQFEGDFDQLLPDVRGCFDRSVVAERCFFGIGPFNTVTSKEHRKRRRREPPSCTGVR